MDLARFVPETEIRTWVGPFWDAGAYLETGRIESERVATLCSLRPDQSILDLGCGCGRMAIHLAGRLDAQGRYLGVDNCSELVEWARLNITPHFPNFRFQFINVQSSYNNPKGTTRPAELRIDLPDRSTDLVMAISLFTHMQLSDIPFYLREARRVLRPGGRLCCTFFLLNEASLGAIEENRATYDFAYDAGSGSRSWRKDQPLEAIAHDEGVVVRLLADAGFDVATVYHGGWRRNSLEDHQDMFLLTVAK